MRPHIRQTNYGYSAPQQGGGGRPPGVDLATTILAILAAMIATPGLDQLTSGFVQDLATRHYGELAGMVLRWCWLGGLALLIYAVARTGFWFASMMLLSSSFMQFIPI